MLTCKRLITAIICFMLVIVSTNVLSATDSNTANDIQKNGDLISKNFAHETVLSEALNEVSSNKARIAKAITKASTQKTDADGETVCNSESFKYSDMNIKTKDSNAFKLYPVISSNIIDDYKTNGKLYDLISDDYSLNVPTYNENDELISLIELSKVCSVDEFNNRKLGNEDLKKDLLEYVEKYQGKYKISVMGFRISKEAVEAFSNYEKINEILKNNDIQNIAAIKYISLDEFHTQMIYILLEDGTELGIPYTKRPDLTMLENGSVYTIENIFDTLSKSFNR